jgi:NADPH:quinone reductase
MTAMRAFAIDDFGGYGSIHELSEPEPDPGDVRIRVSAAGVNPVDWMVSKGRLHREVKQVIQTRFPLALGMDLAGVVDRVGAEVTTFEVGDEVFGLPGKPFFGSGTFAELVTATAETVARKPRAVDHVGAAAVPMAAMTALTAMDAVCPGEDDKVLIVRAAGGVGSFAVQMAAAAGAHVLAVARGANSEYLRELGAAEVIDYEKEDPVEAVTSRYSSGVDVLVDLMGDRTTVQRLFEAVREGGRAACVTRPPADVVTRRRLRAEPIMAVATTERLADVARLLDAGALKLPAIRTYPLERAAEALVESERGHVRGKLVVTVP